MKIVVLGTTRSVEGEYIETIYPNVTPTPAQIKRYGEGKGSKFAKPSPIERIILRVPGHGYVIAPMDYRNMRVIR